MTLNEIAQRIDQAVRSSNDSPDVIAAGCEVSIETLRMWRNGGTVPKLSNLKKFADVVGVSDDWLLVGYSKADVVNANTLPMDQVETILRLANMSPDIRLPIETMIRDLTGSATFEYSMQDFERESVHDVSHNSGDG